MKCVTANFTAPGTVGSDLRVDRYRSQRIGFRIYSWLSAGSLRQCFQYLAGRKDMLFLGGWLFLRRFWNCERVEQELFVRFAMGVGPFLPSLFPGQFAAFFAFEPFVLPNLFLDEITDPIERIGVNRGR